MVRVVSSWLEVTRGAGLYVDTWVVLYLFQLAVLMLAEVICVNVEVTSGKPSSHLPPTTLCLSCLVTKTAVSPSKSRCVDIVLG